MEPNEQIVGVIAGAIRHVAQQRCRPTVISNDELRDAIVSAGRRVSRETISRYGRTTISRYAIWQALGGRAGWGSCVAYSRKGWAV